MEACHAFATKTSMRRLLSGSDRSLWEDAIKKEMNLIFSGGTLVPEIIDPNWTKDQYLLIRSTMQLKMKLNDDGSILKYKARCCAMGNMLTGSISDTYSPTISGLTLATLLQLAVIDQMHMTTIDTIGAYLYQDYPKDATPLYVTLENEVSDIYGLPRGATYRVCKYLYGLPDSGRAYYEAYSQHLIMNGYDRMASDPCLFVRKTASTRTYVFIHVDDTFVASTNPEELTRFQDVLRQRFEITVNPEVDTYLGVHLEKQDNGNIKLSQPKLLAQIFEEYKPQEMSNLTRANAPHRPEASQSTDLTPIPQRDYLHLLGALLYLTKSRPDIATAVSFAACHSTSPTKGDFAELLHIVRYLYNTKDYGLILHSGIPNRELILTCYVDASYLTHPDSKSQTGYCLSFGTIGTFYSRSIKQPLIATSSTHAEMRALYQATIDIIYLINLCEEIHRPIKLPAIVMEDNQPVIDLSAELSGRTKKCKHFLMLVNFIREQVSQGLIDIHKVDTKDNISDLLSKRQEGRLFILQRDILLGRSIKPTTPIV
jgi:hypothetical protein